MNALVLFTIFFTASFLGAGGPILLAMKMYLDFVRGLRNDERSYKEKREQQVIDAVRKMQKERQLGEMFNNFEDNKGGFN
jgi:hypothetical protein